MASNHSAAPRRDARAKRAADLSKAPIIPRLPHCRDSAQNGAMLPPDIIGAKIVGFGAAPPECDLEGGGLIIDHIPKEESEPRRLALAFNELGMWVQPV
jgi:hypothetical protein